MLWNGPANSPDPFLIWPLASGVVASAVFLVLYQAAQGRHPHLPERWSLAGLSDWKRRALDYGEVHETAWTDALLMGLSAIFTGIVMGLAVLLSEMFWLVKIELLRELLRKGWVVALIVGAAYGGGMGLLRDRAPIIGALQRVAMMVLRVLAPVLAVGLVSFLAVLPFTGLAPLWATGNTTPIMLAAAMFALFLVNAVIGERAREAALARPLRWGAMALGLALLPLVLIAAWSTGLRIGQHGLSPDRLWALTFIILATVTAIAYAAAIARPGDWPARLYRSNLHLAFILGGVTFVLSTSLLGFDRIATANQIARLESGKVKPVDFDYRGLWFDFGPPGKAAIKRLAKESGDAQVRKFAADVQKLKNRFEEATNQAERRAGIELDKRLTILPARVPLETKLRERLTEFGACGHVGSCLVHYVPGEDFAVVAWQPDKNCTGCLPRVGLLYRSATGWKMADDDSSLAYAFVEAGDRKEMSGQARTQRAKRLLEAVRTGNLEIRPVQRRQLYLDGKPFGDPIPLENAAEP
jgi:hypothetical protein